MAAQASFDMFDYLTVLGSVVDDLKVDLMSHWRRKYGIFPRASPVHKAGVRRIRVEVI